MKHETGWARLSAVVRRRRIAVIVTTVAVATLGMVVIESMAPVYQARAVVRIDDPRPPSSYVAPLTNEPDVERLKAARLGFLALPLVAAAAEQAKLLPSDPHERELALGLITTRVDARQEGADSYIVTYEDSNRAKAQVFLDALIAGYAARRAAEQAARAAATASFIQAQLDDLRPLVAAADAKIARMRLERFGSLPDQLEANLRMLDESETNVRALMASLDAAHGRKKDILQDIYSPLRHQEESVERDLSVARSRYASDAPEIKTLTAELARVRAERESEEGTAARRVQGSSELKAVNDQIGRLESQIEDVRKRGDELRGRVAGAAKNGEELAVLAIDRDILRERLRTMVQRQQDSAMAAGLEAGVEGRARVTVVEPAWVGALPVKPSKPLYGLAALALAVMLGLGIGFLLDTLDRRVLSTEDVAALTGDLPMLGVVPRLARVGRAANLNNGRAATAAGSDE
jgi:uncharacterized protein involved in exopolysaccharide biosynthesis